jgi:hypothetical protein
MKGRKKENMTPPEKAIVRIKMTAAILALLGLIYSAYTGNVVWGIIFTVGCFLMATVIVRMYKTDYLGELDD